LYFLRSFCFLRFYTIRYVDDVRAYDVRGVRRALAQRSHGAKSTVVYLSAVALPVARLAKRAARALRSLEPATRAKRSRSFVEP